MPDTIFQALGHGIDGLDAPCLTGVPRVLAALERARFVLGPDVVPELDPSEAMNDARLEERVDAALTELRRWVMTYSGPNALDLTRAAYELADVAWLMRLRTSERRVNGLASVQRALAKLRTVGSVELMLRRATQVVCEGCGFDQAILFRIEDETAFPVSAFDRRNPDWESKVTVFAQKGERPILNEMLLETDMLRRRVPAIVHDAAGDPRTYKPWVEVSQIRSYVAAPIAPEGRVIGFLHASVHYQTREVDVIDRDILWAFAEGCGYALERTLLRDQVRQQRERVRQHLREADELVNELGESELRIERFTSDSVVQSSAIPAGGSRIHSLLTPREIEVMELVLRGLTNKQIADQFVVTEGTIKAHVTSVYRKLRAANRAEAVHRYMQLLKLDQG